MHEQTIGDWLTELGSDAPAPGGGAVAALQAAMAAALVEMVCNLTIGKPKYAEHEPTMIEVRDRSAALRADALALAAEDAVAFRAVTAAYRLPRGTETEKTERRQRIQAALANAAEVPARTAELAAEVLDLAARIEPGANVNVLSDVAVAASSVHAAVESALVNVEVNLALLTDQSTSDALAARVERCRAVLAPAADLVAVVRERIAR